MTGFIEYHDGIFKTQIRRADGAGIADLHAAGECPRDCVICARAKTPATEQERVTP